MKRQWIFACVLLLLFAGGSSVFAADARPVRIFGFALNAPFPKELRARLRGGEDGFLHYQSKCPEPDAPFGLINVRVSPKRHMVVDIAAAGVFHEASKGEAAFWRLKDKLEARYGKAKKKKQTGGDRFEIFRGKLRVLFYLRRALFEEHSILYVNFMNLGAYEKYGKEARAALGKQGLEQSP